MHVVSVDELYTIAPRMGRKGGAFLCHRIRLNGESHEKIVYLSAGAVDWLTDVLKQHEQHLARKSAKVKR